MWAGCINGALPEQEYLDLVRQAGFVDAIGTRSLSGGELAGVEVYSMAVTARKAQLRRKPCLRGMPPPWLADSRRRRGIPATLRSGPAHL